jgi:hypothetical protein
MDGVPHYMTAVTSFVVGNTKNDFFFSGAAPPFAAKPGLCFLRNFAEGSTRRTARRNGAFALNPETEERPVAADSGGSGAPPAHGGIIIRFRIKKNSKKTLHIVFFGLAIYYIV